MVPSNENERSEWSAKEGKCYLQYMQERNTRKGGHEKTL